MSQVDGSYKSSNLFFQALPNIIFIIVLFLMLFREVNDQQQIQTQIQNSAYQTHKVFEMELALAKVSSAVRGYVLAKDKNLLSNVSPDMLLLSRNMATLQRLNTSGKEATVYNEMKRKLNVYLTAVESVIALQERGIDFRINFDPAVITVLNSLYEDFNHCIQNQWKLRSHLHEDLGRSMVRLTILILLSAMLVLFLTIRNYRRKEKLYRIAQDAVRERENFMSIVSHDLKNPLYTIQLSTQLLEKNLEKNATNDLSKELKKKLPPFKRSTEQALGLIRDLMDLTRIRNGSLQLDKQLNNPCESMNKVLEMMAPQLEEKGIRIINECNQTPDIIYDGDRILQVISNIMANALKFTPRDGTITLSTQDNGHEMWFIIKDSGPGLDPKTAPYIFEKFWKDEANSKDNLGLGLSICKGIVEMHGGKIWAESQPGEGATFIFTLPAQRK